MLRVILACLIGVFEFGPQSVLASERELSIASNPLVQISGAVERLINQVSPSVVQLVVTAYRPVNDSENSSAMVVGRRRSVGSGVVIDRSGLIVTNAHVIRGAERIEVAVSEPGEGGSPPTPGGRVPRLLSARVVGVAPEIDLALIQVDASDLSPLLLADYAQLRQGELVFAVGSPGGLRNSVSMGVVSATGQQVEADSPLVYVQTDAAINPGSSGGPLVNVHGKVVGINTMIQTLGGGSDGVGFALPSALVAAAVPQLREFGHLHRAVTGLSVQTVTPVIRAGLGLEVESGLLIGDVAPGGPAEAAGGRIGDVITSIDGQPVDRLNMAAMYVKLFTLRDGQTLTFSVMRGETPITLSVVAAIPLHHCEGVPALMDSRESVVEALGIMGRAVDLPLAAALQARSTSGVVVTALVETREPRDLGLVPGDLIRSVNRTVVTSLEGLREALARVEPKREAVFQVERQGQLTYVALEIP